MILDPKVLEAAQKEAGCETGHERALVEIGIHAVFDAADLVDGKEHITALENVTAAWRDERTGLIKERDGARLELDVTKKLYHQALDDLEAAVIVYKAERKVTDKRGRQLAALREALKWALAYAGPAVEGSYSGQPAKDKLAKARAAIAATTEAAAQYQWVPEGWQVMPIQRWPALSELMSGDDWQRILATAPKAGEPEGK